MPADQTARLVMGFLSELAYGLHARRRAFLTHAETLEAVQSYLDECDIRGIQPLDVLEFVRSAGILMEDRACDEIRFNNVNHLAFFIAKRIDGMMSNPRRTEDDEWRSSLERLYNEICYGVNETVLLFLSYMKEDAFLPIELCERADSLLTKIEKAEDFSFARRTAQFKMPSMATDSDRKVMDRMMDEQELALEERRRLDTIEYHDIYDYDIPVNNESDPLIITRASRYMVMAVRSSSVQINMKREDKDRIVNSLYHLGAKIIGVMALRYGKTFDVTVKEAYSDLQKVHDGAISLDDISDLYSALLISVGLNVLDGMVQPIGDEFSAERMLRYMPESVLDRIIALLIHSHRADPEYFCKCAVKLMEYTVRYGNPADQFAVRLVTYVYIVNHPRLSQRLIDKLADKVFDDGKGTKRKEVLLFRHNS